MRSCTQKQCHICNHKWNRVPAIVFRKNEYRSWQHLHWISHNKTISELNLTSNFLGDSEDLTNFSDELKNNHSITNLDLSNNKDE